MLIGGAVNHIFRSNDPVTYNALSEIMLEHTRLIYWPDEEQMLDPYGFDVWYCEFMYDHYLMHSTFRLEGGDLVLFEAFIWIFE